MEHSILFTPKNINKLNIKNRIIMSAMHLGYSDDKQVSEKGIEFYKARAKGGAGAIVLVGAINELAGPPNMHFLSEDKYITGINKLANALHEYDTKLFVQLFHCGRNAVSFILGGETPLAPSAVASPIYKEIPKEMTIDDIENTIRDFGEAAKRCKKAGADGVEISCSAGYLLTQFLSPLTNLRTDEYGGCKENRMRFPKRVIKEVREQVGEDYPVILRISGSDMMPGGYSIEFMQEFCASLTPGLIDAINVTGGWHESPVPQITYHVPEGGYAFLAYAIKKVVNIPVIASNRINNGEIADSILESGQADFVGVARGFLADAEFANKVKIGKKYRPCMACNKGCIENVLKGMDACCAYNPEIGKEGNLYKKSHSVKKILIIGAGPAGMQAAKTLKLCGQEVILCTNEGKLGGKLYIAAAPPHKKGINNFIDAMEEELKDLNIDIRLNTEVDEEYIKKINPDKVVVATGAIAKRIDIEGFSGENIYLAEDVIKGDKDLINKIIHGKTVIVGGSSVGLETALFLGNISRKNSISVQFTNVFFDESLKKSVAVPNSITIVEKEPKAGKDLGGLKWILMKELKELNINVITNWRGRFTTFNPDNIILAIGYRPNPEKIVNYLEKEKIPYCVIGDSLKPKGVMEALKSGFNISKKILD